VSMLRAYLKLILFALLMGLVYGGYGLRGLFIRSPAKREAWRRTCFRCWARHASRILGVECSIEGRPPTPPFLLVCNHLSYVDVIVLASLVDGRFVAKRDVASWSLLGGPIRAAGTIFVDRNRHPDLVRVNEVMQEALGRGEGIVFFPEGTSSNGADVLPFKSSLLAFAAGQQYPVHYAAISYRTPANTPSPDGTVCWWGDMDFPDHFMKFLRIQKVHTSIVFGDEPVREPNRKVLANKLHEAVQRAFTPVVRKEEPCMTQSA